MELVILVDEKDTPLGEMEKMEAHYKGVLHRAFSVFLHDGKGKVLLQKRALSKYHSGGLLTNACCSHPRKGESVVEAAHRRLIEELGVDCPVEEVSQFIYRAELDKDMIEHELDHVLTGVLTAESIPFNPEEVHSISWMDFEALQTDIKNNPDKYTAWFRIIMDNVDKDMLML